MNGASKILTVSYGTFSCTLEGFDEPFNTMKAIAEYFRDLAAEDRYFGAEPPTPDAAMLHRIAEREIQRRVEAKIEDNGLVLRAEQGVTPKVTFPSRPPQTQTAEPAPAPILSSVAEAAPAIDSAAARLSRLRAAQVQAQPAPLHTLSTPLAAPFPSYIDAYADEPEQDLAAPAPVVAPAPAAPVAAEASPESLNAAAEAAAQKLAEKAARRARKAKQIEAAATAQAETKPAVAPIAAEIAAEVPAEIPADSGDILARVTKASAQPQAPAQPKPAVLQTEAAKTEAAIDSLAAAIRETLAGMGAADDQLAIDISDSVPAIAAFPEARWAEEDVSELDRVDENWIEEADLLPEDLAPAPEDAYVIVAEQDLADAAPPPIEDAVAEDATANIAAPVAVASLAGIAETAVDAQDVQAEADHALLATEAEAPSPEAIAATADLTPPAPPVADKLQRARARVIKIRRLEPAPAEPMADQPAAPAQLSPEAEADLQNELAALEAELVAPKPAPEPARQPQAETPPRATDPALTDAHRLAAAKTDDADVNRLLAKTNTEFDVPETKRRRSAIAHLKAAVLATVAERRNNPNGKKPDQRMDPYRKDLDQAVRPGDRSGERPAPLVLVSSQRIDRKPDDAPRPQPQAVPQAQPAAQQPALVRPRRVTSGGSAQALSAHLDMEDDLTPDDMDNVFADPGKQTFPEFVSTLGAQSMQDLIEASAAYCTLVLGLESFTRPLLFQQIEEMPGQTELSREDGLRGFGRLLRDGRLTKTKRGQYALAETSPILIEARRRTS